MAFPKREIRLPRPAHVRFDERAAERAVRFFEEELRHTKGRRHAGRPFILTEEQRTDIREIFGRVDEEGNRIIRQVFKEIPKKNGKSEEAAGIANKLLYADSEPSAEIYGAAADITQASIVFSVAASMVRHNPKLLSRSKIWDSTKRIVVPGSESYYRAVTSKVAGKHGFNASGIIFDEVHTQPNMDLWEVLTFGSGAARSQPLVFAITTAGIIGESPVAEMLHDEADQILRGILPCPDHFYPVMYGAPENADWHDENVWVECNPFIREGLMRIEDIRLEHDDACRRPSQENTFRRLRLNQWVRQDVRYIDMDQWRGCSGPVNVRDLRHLTWYGGLDLSSKLDVTALVLVAQDGNGVYYVLPFFWIPEDNVQPRPNQETEKYRVWIRQRFLNATPGNEVEYAQVRNKLRELRDQVGLRLGPIAYDPAFAGMLAQVLADDGFQMATFIQRGYRHWNEAMLELESALRVMRIRHGGHPVLDWMADNARARQNPDGMLRPVKPDRQKSGKRIDGIVAMIMALTRVLDGSGGPSIYANHETAVM